MLEVLAHLVTHRERVVPKGELLDKLWDGVAGVGVGADADDPRGPPESGALAGRPWIRTVYFALVGALEAGLVRTAEDPDRAAQASQPLGPMGAEWLKRQERDL